MTPEEKIQALELQYEIVYAALEKCAAQAKFVKQATAKEWVEEVLLDRANGTI